MTTLAEEQKVARQRASSHQVAELLFRFRELGIVLALVIVVGATTIDNHLFLSATSVQQLLSGAAIVALLAIGETIVVVTRNVDLSIGSVLGISAYAVGVLYRGPSACPARASSSCSALGIGAACGVGERADRHRRARAQPRRHARNALHHPRDRRCVGRRQPGQRVDAARELQQDRLRHVAGVPYLGIIAIVAVAIATYAMRTFRTARDFYAIGSDPAAARLAGIPVGSRVFLAFVLSGGIAGIAGAIWLSYFGSVDAIAGVGYEFQVIAAVVVGGVAIFGGSGTVLGAALGALLLNTINSALVVVNVSSFWSQAVAGALLVGCDRVRPADRGARCARSCAREGVPVAELDDVEPGGEAPGEAPDAGPASASSCAGRRCSLSFSAARSRTAPPPRRISSSRQRPWPR